MLGLQKTETFTLLFLFTVLVAVLGFSGLDDRIMGWVIWNTAPSISTEMLGKTPCKLWKMDVDVNDSAAGSRKLLPGLIRSLADAGARVVAIDVLLEDVQEEVDQDLGKAIIEAAEKNTRVIFGIDAALIKESPSPSRDRSLDYPVSPLIKNELGSSLREHVAQVRLRLHGEAIFNQSPNWWKYDLLAYTPRGNPAPSLALEAYRAFKTCSMDWQEARSSLRLFCKNEPQLDVDAPDGFMFVPQWDPDEFKSLELRASKGADGQNAPFADDVKGQLIVVGYPVEADKHEDGSGGPRSPYGYKHHLNMLVALLNGMQFRFIPLWLDILWILVLLVAGVWAKRYSMRHSWMELKLDWVQICIPLVAVFFICAAVDIILLRHFHLGAGYGYHLAALTSGYVYVLYETGAKNPVRASSPPVQGEH